MSAEVFLGEEHASKCNEYAKQVLRGIGAGQHQQAELRLGFNRVVQCSRCDHLP